MDTLLNDLPADPAATAQQAVSWLQRLGLHLTPSQENLLISGLIFLGFLLLALCIRLLFRSLLRRLAARTRTLFDDRVLRSLESPVIVFVLLTGVMSALAPLHALQPVQAVIIRLYGAAVLVLGIVIGVRVLAIAIEWYAGHLAPRIGDTAFHYAGLSRKILAGILWAVGGVVVLGHLGVEITPLVTTLGLGSLAVALALQDTLANFFAGIYLMLDRPVKVGDFVRLDTGDEGFVDAIGWRSTRVRLWSNYIVVIPNTRLTSSVITNMVMSESVTSVYIPGGVSYLSDLDHVERVLLDVAREVTSRVEGAAPEAEPLVRFQEFGDSNITFLVILKVTDFSFQYALKHEYIKAVFRRFRQEGIEISWPVRQLVAPHPIPVTLAERQACPAAGHRLGSTTDDR